MHSAISEDNHSGSSFRLTVGFATTGRADVLARTVAHLERQTRLPDRIIISAISDADHEGAVTQKVPLEILTTARGLTQQRNHIIDQCTADDVLMFFDDDFVPCDDYLDELEKLFVKNPDIVMATGKVLADGILTEGLTFDEASQIAANGPTMQSDAITPVYNAYGCNMAVRCAALKEPLIRLDENLPLYSWWEDVDFSRLLAPYGRIVRADSLCGVHMGVKSGRTPGQRLGYSQIVNPYYLVRKGTVAWNRAASQAVRNLLANTAKSLRPEPHIDRAGRLKGNLIGLWHIATARADPKHILNF